MNSPRAIANARLIAAAPDLLAACKALLKADFAEDCQECGIGRSQAWQAMRVAIAKAEGTDAP